MAGATTTTSAAVVLKVVEGRPQDAGRGLARLDPADIARLGASAGSIVQITGKKAAAAKVMPAFRELRGKQVVQTTSAQRIVLAPEGSHVLRQLGTEQICRSLADLPVMAGDRVRVTGFGSRFQEFRVVDTTPRGIVVVRPDTTVRLEAAGKQAATGRVSYEDIGGVGPAN